MRIAAVIFLASVLGSIIITAAGALITSSDDSVENSARSSVSNNFYNTSHLIMPWLCLQRCQFNISQIKAHVADIAKNNEKFANQRLANVGGSSSPLLSQQEPLINAIAFEKFNLGPNATLVHNNLFNLSGYLLEVFNNSRQQGKAKLRRPLRIAMVSSYPYPKDFLKWMRELFRSSNGTSQRWIEAVGSTLVQEQIDGINIDFEPTTSASAEDAKEYAAFLKRLRIGLWKFKRTWALTNQQEEQEEEDNTHLGLITTATTATWASMWNLTEIADALLPSVENGESPYSMGYATTMNTYTFMDRYFEPQLEQNLAAFGRPPSSEKPQQGEEGWRRLVTGFETWPNNFTSTELSFHFDRLKHYNLCRLAMWDAPIPDFFWPHLYDFGKRCM